MARPRRGRPNKAEAEVTVASYGQLSSWPLRKSKGDFELNITDDLINRRGFKIYREMLADDQIKACLRFKKLLVSGRAWEIAPAGDSEQDKNIAKFVEKALKRTKWNRITRDILSALDFGFSVGELLWEIIDGNIIEEAGPKLVLKDIKHRDPEWLKIDVDVHGNLRGFRQQTGYMPVLGEIHIPIEKVIHYGYQSEFSNHYGISDLRAAYRAWWSKKFVTQFYNVFLERFGQPPLVMKYPQGASPELKASLQKILAGLSSKSEILIPEGVMAELLEATRAGTAGYNEALTYFDIAISKALLVPALLGMGTDVKRGADSQSRLHLRVLMKVVNDISNDIAEAVSDSIIKPMVDFNYDVTQYPKFIYQDYGEYEAVEITDAIKEWFNAGILDLDQEDINYGRSILGLPIRGEDNEDEILRSMPPPIGTSPNNPNDPANPGAQGAGAKQGNNRASKGPSSQKTRRMK